MVQGKWAKGLVLIVLLAVANVIAGEGATSNKPEDLVCGYWKLVLKPGEYELRQYVKITADSICFSEEKEDQFKLSLAREKGADGKETGKLTAFVGDKRLVFAIDPAQRDKLQITADNNGVMANLFNATMGENVRGGAFTRATAKDYGDFYKPLPTLSIGSAKNKDTIKRVLGWFCESQMEMTLFFYEAVLTNNYSNPEEDVCKGLAGPDYKSVSQAGWEITGFTGDFSKFHKPEDLVNKNLVKKKIDVFRLDDYAIMFNGNTYELLEDSKDRESPIVLRTKKKLANDKEISARIKAKKPERSVSF